MTKVIIAFAVVLTVLVGVRVFLGGEEDGWVCQNNQWVKHGNPSESQPQTGCGTPVLSLNNSIAKSLGQKYNKPAANFMVTTTQELDNYAKGSVTIEGEMGGALWFAAKVDGQWQLVFDGNGVVTCDGLKKYPQFPKNLIPQCLDLSVNKLITR